MIEVAAYEAGSVSWVRDRLVPIVGAMLLATALCAGCAKPQPDVAPELPPLAAPPPPARLLPPLDGGPIEGAATPPPPEAGRPSTPARRRDSARPESPRQEPKPAELPRAEPASEGQRPAGEAGGAEPAPVLQLAPTTESAVTEETIRQQLTRAARDLGHVDYGALSADAKAQYDTAKRFIVLADQAIKDRNIVFARTLADKAAVIAGVLSNR
jgi:hypothetical protein